MKRLGKRLRPERPKVIAVVVAAVASVALTAIGPRVLGRATDIIFSGVVGSFLPEGMTKEQAVETVRAQGQGQLADMISGVDLIPGVGIDFTALRNTLILALIVYALSALLGFLQAYFLNDVVQHTVLRMRAEVEDKINRLPLRYFDRVPRGELLSRVTNDIDNLSQSLQQTISQILTSLLTLLGVTIMMFTISPLLAAIALVTVPTSVWLMKVISKRARPRFIAQWGHTG